MIRVSVMYPNGAGSYFDMAYYCKTHIPMAQRLLAPALKGVTVEQGIGGGAPDSPAPYLAIGHLQFDSVEAFQTAFAPHGQELMDDIPNYTNIQPVIQISAVRLQAASGHSQTPAPALRQSIV